MNYIEVLCWGIAHIAKNHGFGYAADYEGSGEVCIYGGCNVPTVQDVRFLCEDLGIDIECVESSDFGIDVWLTPEWYEEKGQEEYKPTGLEMWKRYGVKLGS